jgi:hypothetical protein
VWCGVVAFCLYLTSHLKLLTLTRPAHKIPQS